MKKVVSILAVCAICLTIGGALLSNNGVQPVAEHGVAPGSNAIVAF